MRILHFSDVHIGVPLRRMRLDQWFGKRALGGVNLIVGRQRRFEAARRKLQELARFAARDRIDLTVFTGDYTGLGLDSELAAARAAIEPFLEGPGTFVNVPGNHDVYVPEVLRKGLFERHFGDTLESDLPEHQVDGPWPLARLLGDHVAVVAVNSARPNPQPWRSNGRIPDVQIAALRGVLDDDRVRGRWTLVATHYAARLADGSPDRRLHGLVNSDAFLHACAEIPRGAILCGHVHHRYRVRIAGVGPTLYCAGSATMQGREGCWMYEIDSAGASAIPVDWREGRYVADPDGRKEL